MGPLSYGEEEDDTLGLEEEGVSDLLAGDALSVGATGASGIGAAYDAAIKRLLAQRQGLSRSQMVGAALLGFSQPSRHGWRNSVVNAANMVSKQALSEREKDEKRRAQLEKLMMGRDIASAKDATALEVAKIRSNKPPKLANDTDQRMRLGYAQRLFPGKTPEQIVGENLLYDPRVDKAMFRVYGVRAAAGAGEDVDEVEVAPEVPTLEVFLVAAREANPGVPDAELTAYYNKKYGGQ